MSVARGGLINRNRSIEFFDTQFQRQLREQDFELNPFERAALPYLRGRVLEYGCGMGNLALQAARKGCRVVALDACRSSITHLQQQARREALPLQAEELDLREYEVREDFDAVVCIGVLMFFDCATALHQLALLQQHVSPGGIAVVNVLTAGTTYMDMFAPEGHCLFDEQELCRRFAGWELLVDSHQEFAAPAQTRKRFHTVIARKPQTVPAATQ